MKLLPIVVAVLLAASAAAQAAPAKHLDLRSACKAGSVPAHIGGKSVCLHIGLKCRARYERAYEKKGFECVNGLLQKIPAPSPPPTALEGLYRFNTSQCLAPTLCNMGTLTVLPGGLTATNFVAPFWEDCTPPNHFVSLLSTYQDVPFTIAPGLMFEISGTFSIQNRGTPPIPNGSATATLNGQFDTAGNVSGKFDVHVSGDDSAGTHYECDTGQITFSGKLSSH